MFGSKAPRLTMQDVNSLVLTKGYESRFEPLAAGGNVGRISYVAREINFWITFGGISHEFDSVNFFTAIPADEPDFKRVNDFNTKMRLAKLTYQDGSLCLAQNCIVAAEGMTKDGFSKNFALWEFAVTNLAEWLSDEDQEN